MHAVSLVEGHEGLAQLQPSFSSCLWNVCIVQGKRLGLSQRFVGVPQPPFEILLGRLSQQAVDFAGGDSLGFVFAFLESFEDASHVVLYAANIRHFQHEDSHNSVDDVVGLFVKVLLLVLANVLLQ